MSITERALSALERVSHELPSQRPLNFFIHHNPLHAYEHLPFCEGVERAAERWRARPWLSEEAYRAHYSSARILSRDVSAVIADELPDDPLVLGRVRLRELVKSLMTSAPPTPPQSAISWALEEGELLRAWLRGTPREAVERFREGPPAEITLRALWERSEQEAERLITQETTQETTQEPTGQSRASLRWRRVVEELSGENIDLLVHPLLIKHCAAFLDVSFAAEGLPSRGEGLLSSALALVEASPAFARPWLSSLKRTLSSLGEGSRSAEALLTSTLERTGVQEGQLEGLWWGMVEALPGWPGMLSVLCERPDLSPSPLPPLSLRDFFVLRLLLEESATRHALSLSDDEPLPSLRACTPHQASDQGRAERVAQLTWGLFHAAQLAGVLPAELPTVADELRELLTRFGEVRRRRLWHFAFERRYRVDALDAFLGRQAQQRAVHQAPQAWLRVMTCIDDREESMRRHLEELDAGVETFGYAGFYGVAMFYQPLGAPHARALCPAVITPKHLVREVPLEGEEARWRARQSRHRLLGALHAHDQHSRRSPLRGTLNALAGLVSALPMAYRLLTPKRGAQLGMLGRAHRGTRLELERPSEGPLSAELSPERRPHGTEGAEALYMGFTLEERAHIVRQTLGDMGLSLESLKEGAPLTLCLGHGSRSINNPYEAGYQCGACGGGHGGASGRAFAQMVNDPEVRALLSGQGVELPAHVTFIGGAHDTCDDSVTLYDVATVRAQLEARLKASELSDVQRTQALKDFEEALERALKLIDEARAVNALERARRFELAPRHMSPQQALTHVEHRAHDLSEPRPEYNHATNALQIVAPRALTRGLFLDRRAFLTSYDHTLDPHGEALKRLLAAAVPVGAGINLEYFFSMVDPKRYGAGSKLPQNIVALLGVMDGHQSDLRTGLVWQMVEIHEPMRLLNIIVTPRARVNAVLRDLPQVAQLVLNGWVQVAVYDPDEGALFTFERGALTPYTPERLTLPRYERSQELWRGRSEHLPFALITGLPTGTITHMEAH